MFTRISIAGAASLLIAACAMSPAQPPSPSAAGIAHAPAPSASTAMAPAAMRGPIASPDPTPTPVATIPSRPAQAAARKRPIASTSDRQSPLRNEQPKTAAAATVFELTGRVALTGSRGQPVSAADYAQTLVYFVPNAGTAAPRPGHYSVFTHNRDFNPEAMAVPLGSTLTFVNQDDVRHNVFSVTPGSTFDLGYQAQGASVSHRFDQPGLVLVSCKVHRSMQFDLLVVPTSFVARAGADGRFALDGLPAGAGTLHFWNPRAEPAHLTVKLPDARAISETLVIGKPPLATQLHVGATR